MAIASVQTIDELNSHHQVVNRIGKSRNSLPESPKIQIQKDVMQAVTKK